MAYRTSQTFVDHARTSRSVRRAIRICEERARASRLEALARLAGGIAHEFNDILTAVLGNVSLARARMPIDQESDEALAEAERACVRGRRLTEQLLVFAKGGAPERTPLRLEHVIRQAIDAALAGSTVSCTIHIDPTVWPVNGDERQLVQALTNILINARRAMPNGGRVVVRAQNVSEPVYRWERGVEVAAGSYASVTVADEGGGIGPDDIDRIFEPYSSTAPAGVGLGLASALSIVKNHGGYIAVDSQRGRGTTVRVALPALRAGALHEQAPAITRSMDARC